MNVGAHWETVYHTKAPEAVSWFRPHLEMSLALIERAGGGPSASVIDVGGGESTLVDDLLSRGYEQVTVLDGLFRTRTVGPSLSECLAEAPIKVDQSRHR